MTGADLDAFLQANERPLAAAREFCRRAKKGLPSDRFGSDRDMHDVARGIAAMDCLIDTMGATIAALYAELTQNSANAVEAARDPMRD